MDFLADVVPCPIGGPGPRSRRVMTPSEVGLSAEVGLLKSIWQFDRCS